MSEDPASDIVEIDAAVSDVAGAEVASAEAWEHGACGIEERPGEGGSAVLRIWAPARHAEALRAALAASGVVRRVAPARPFEQRDWSQAWREGLAAVRASERVVVRPSFVPREPGPGEHVLVVDPAQAFGTGHHASTRLALSLLDAELAARAAGAAVLDVGTGSGLLVLAALVLGAGSAVGLDLDPLAAPEARRNARTNGLAAHAHFFTGSLDALAAVAFDVVVANLIRSELLPLLDAICSRHVKASGALVLSGLLAEDLPRIETELERRGLAICAERREAEGTDTWLGLLAQPAARP